MQSQDFRISKGLGEVDAATQVDAETEEAVEVKAPLHDLLPVLDQDGRADVDVEVGSCRARPQSLPQPQHLHTVNTVHTVYAEAICFES